MRRFRPLLAAFVVAALALAPSLADARAGGGSSFGSRGGRTFSAPSSTSTAPGASPMERTMTARPSPGYGAPSAPGYTPSRMGGFTSGLLGGLLGAGIGGLLFGHGMFGGGGFGFIGLLIQLALLYFVVRWLFRTFFSHRPAMAGAGMPGAGMSMFNRMGQPAPGMAATPGGGGAPPVTIAPADYQAYEQLLVEMQAAWSAQDLRHLQAIATPEMVSYFGEQLAQQSSRGVRNSVTSVKLEKGDLSEAWSEGSREYATVAMRFSMIDVTVDSTGRVVEGDPTNRALATELWTFVRAPGGRWLLSAIQQAH
jgi:predicted lipid-binding transport protein (Tim44 family)